MTLFKSTLAAVVFLSVGVEVGASTASGVVSKGDLGISLAVVSTNAEDKGDCNCAESLYGSNTGASGFHKGYGENIQPIVIPAAASASAEIINVPMAKAMRKKLKHIATKDGGISPRGNARRATTCVFGAPNASGCRQN
jgi:hypothetical protein